MLGWYKKSYNNKQHAQTNTFPILIPSVTLPLCRFLVFPYTPILPPRLFPLPLPPGRKTNLMPSLLCLLFYDAFSDHTFLFLCVSMHLEAELSTQEERRAHKTEKCRRQQRSSSVLVTERDLRPAF